MYDLSQFKADYAAPSQDLPSAAAREFSEAMANAAVEDRVSTRKPAAERSAVKRDRLVARIVTHLARLAKYRVGLT